MTDSYAHKRIIFDSIEPDLQPELVSLNIANNAQNLRYNKGGIERINGYSPIFGTFLDSPLIHFGVVYSTLFQYIYAGTTKIGVVGNDSVHYDLTPVAGINATQDENWTGGLIHGVPFLSNPNDFPMYWDGNIASDFATLPNWPSGTYVNGMRPFLNFLVAFGVSDAAGDYDDMVMWSDAADAGDIPQSWDHTDPTKKAGRARISARRGLIIDAVPLRDVLIVYKENSTHYMQFVGGSAVFVFRDVFQNIGILGSRCAIEFRGKHAVFTRDDIIVHDARTAESIVNNRVRETVFGELNTDSALNSFVFHYPIRNEIWFCYPTGNSTNANKALIWNYLDNKFGFRDLPNTKSISYGLVDITSDALSWSTDTDTWVNDETKWNQSYLNSLNESPTMMVGAVMHQLDIGSDDNGADINCYFEKIGLSITEEAEKVILISSVIPNIVGTEGDILFVSLGSQMNRRDPISWNTEKQFVCGQSERVYDLVKGRFISIKIRSSGGKAWRLNSLTFEFSLNEKY